MTHAQLERHVHMLTAYAVGATIFGGLVLLGGFQAEETPQADDVIRAERVVAERIEVVESDGDPVLLMANAEHFPRAEERVRDEVPGKQSGILFYTGEGEEIGALATRAVETDTGRFVATQLKFDRFDHNSVISVAHEETPSYRATGFLVNDQVGTPTDRETVRRVEVASAEEVAWLALMDSEARPRIRMEVDSSGAARLVFLDEEGTVSHRYPPDE